MTSNQIKTGQLVQVSYEPRFGGGGGGRTQWMGKVGVVTWTNGDFVKVAFPDDTYDFWPAELDLIGEAKDGMPSR
jgi:ribosomal protein L21E